jgi:hypothetical protein
MALIIGMPGQLYQEAIIMRWINEKCQHDLLLTYPYFTKVGFIPLKVLFSPACSSFVNTLL